MQTYAIAGLTPAPSWKQVRVQVCVTLHLVQCGAPSEAGSPVFPSLPSIVCAVSWITSSMGHKYQCEANQLIPWLHCCQVWYEGDAGAIRGWGRGQRRSRGPPCCSHQPAHHSNACRRCTRSPPQELLLASNQPRAPGKFTINACCSALVVF